MFNVEMGMGYSDFFDDSNMQKLQSLSKTQKQKIANFWQDDEDKKVTNEIELAILEGFMSKDGKIKMPREKKRN